MQSPENRRFTPFLLIAFSLFVLLYLTYAFLFANASSRIATQQTQTALPTSTATANIIQTRVAEALASATAQTATAVASQPTVTPTNTPRPLRDQLMDIIASEADASKQGDVGRALSLYAANAEVVDASTHTTWAGLDEIRSRYIDTFSRFEFLENKDEFIDLVQDSDVSATIRVTQTGTVLDLGGGTPFPTPPNRESWQFVKLDDGWKISVFTYFLPLSPPTYYTIMNYHSKLCLEVLTHPERSGAAVVQDYCTGADNQRWQFLQQNNGTYKIILKYSDMCLDIDGKAEQDDGLIQRACDPTRDTQLWTAQEYGSYIAIKGVHRGLCVDDPGFSLGPTTQILYYGCNATHDGVNDANQLWLQSK